MKVVVAQFAAGRDVAANTQASVALIAEAAASGADLAILPEISMYFDPRREGGPGPHGQSVDGAFATAIADAARTHGIAVIAGMLEAAPGLEKDYNTVIVVGPAGQRIGHYRKIHLYDAFGFRESDTYLPGPIEAPPVFDIGGLRVAVLTCYDLRFPEAFRWVVDAGAELGGAAGRVDRRSGQGGPLGDPAHRARRGEHRVRRGRRPDRAGVLWT